MELISHQEIATVTLFDLSLSESELMVYESCIAFVLKMCDDELISQITGCGNAEELAAFQEDLLMLIKNYVSQDYLPDKYKTDKQ